MAAASSQSARDRNGPLLARATCPWWRTRARTRSLICLPASVCQLARSNVTQSCSFRTKSVRHAPLSIVGSFECSVKRTFFSFFGACAKWFEGKGRARDCFGRILNAAGGFREFRLQVWSNLEGFVVALFDFRFSEKFRGYVYARKEKDFWGFFLNRWRKFIICI